MSTNTNVKPNTARPNQQNQIDLMELATVLLSRWYLLIICAIVGAVVMGYLNPKIEYTPIYRSQSMLFVARTGSITSFSDLQLGSYMKEDFIVIAKSKPVLDTTIRALYEKDGVALTRSEASGAIMVEEIEDTHIIRFSATHTDPKIACDLCNALTDAMADQIAYIMSTDRPTIVEYAEASNIPINAGSSSNRRQIAMGALGGFAICAMILSVMYLMDDKIKTAEDVEKYFDVPVLASIPLDKAQTFKKSKRATQAGVKS